MDFTFPREMEKFRKLVREFGEEVVRPAAKAADEKHEVDMDVIRQAAAIGLLGVPFPQKYGGVGAGETGYCILMEELGKVCTSTATTIGAHIGIGAMSIYLDGTEAQKQKYLVPLARGEKLGAFALTEPNAGSDAASIKTKAVRDGDAYLLNGSKIYITNGPLADVISVLAVTDPTLGAHGGVTAFIGEKQFGIQVGTVEKKMGIRGSATSELIFEDVRIPAENVLGPVGLGFITFMKTLDTGRLTLGAATLGGAEEALRIAIDYARVREAFGKPIAHKQSIQFMIADMAAEVEALRSLVYRTAWMVEQGMPYTKEAGMCKLLGSQTASRNIHRALQILGALGYSRDFPVERMFRDARIAEIFEGTNEIQRIVIASQLFKEVGIRIRP